VLHLDEEDDEHDENGLKGHDSSESNVDADTSTDTGTTATTSDTTPATTIMSATNRLTFTAPAPMNSTSLQHLPTCILPESCTVMFVDDDTLLRRLFSRSLAKVRPKWRIQEACNGETAIELATQANFEIIFMDQYMASHSKQMLGTEAVRALRARGVTSIICGLSANEMMADFQDAGADTFVLKPLPCKHDALLETLQMVWSSRQ
jgi:CheY-like chemotaxis protein